MIRIKFGKCLLLTILNRKHMTQVDLSEATGIAKSQISEYISGNRKMSLLNARLIAYALNVTVDELYEWIIKK